MRIGLDVRYLSHGLTGGVRTYVHHLAATLPRLAPDWPFFYYADTKMPLDLPGPLPSNVEIRMLPWRSLLSTLRNDARIADWMGRDRVDVAHFPANYGPSGPYRLVVTVHDALNLFPIQQHLRGFGRKPRQVAMMLYLGYHTRRALRDAALVITVSQHARHDIASRTGCSVDRIVAIHEAADPRFRVVDGVEALDELRARWTLGSLTILADAIKNPAALLEAWRRLPLALRAHTTLVFFSREATARPELQSALAVDSQIRFLTKPSVDELVLLMNVADVFVFPSFYEGFGLPLVEAMQCGTPVIASARGAIPEVVGEAALLFAVEDVARLAEHLERALTDGAIRARLRAASLRRAGQFSWETTARSTLDVYQRALSAEARARP